MFDFDSPLLSLLSKFFSPLQYIPFIFFFRSSSFYLPPLSSSLVLVFLNLTSIKKKFNLEVETFGNRFFSWK